MAILYMCQSIDSYAWSWAEAFWQTAFQIGWPRLTNAAGEPGFEDPFLHFGDKKCEGYCGRDYHITQMYTLDKVPVCFMTQLHNNVSLLNVAETRIYELYSIT